MSKVWVVEEKRGKRWTPGSACFPTKSAAKAALDEANGTRWRVKKYRRKNSF